MLGTTSVREPSGLTMSMAMPRLTLPGITVTGLPPSTANALFLSGWVARGGATAAGVSFATAGGGVAGAATGGAVAGIGGAVTAAVTLVTGTDFVATGSSPMGR